MANHKARKRFGQNFLQDQHVIDQIIRSIQPSHSDHVVEVGPGQGALTGPLLAEVGQLDAIELDRDLYAALRDRHSEDSRLNLIQGDVLRLDFSRLQTAEEQLRVVGNLPYNITTPLLFRLIGYSSLFSDMHFMLQKEVVDRLTAAPGSRTFGRLSVMVQYRCRVECLFDVPATAFFPQPKVESAVVRLQPRTEIDHPVTNQQDFKAIVAEAFSKRRKTLRNALKSSLSAAEILSCDIDPATRAETLSVRNFVTLANIFSAKSLPGALDR